jgi:putative addiction module CopG family antidote
MTISLTPELTRFVDEQVRSGRYKTNSEVIRAALRALADEDLRLWLRDGLDALEAGKRPEAGAAIAKLRTRLKQPA